MAPRSSSTVATLDPSEPVADVASEPFVGRWNRLVSVTNWEKGKIIVQWRATRMDEGADPAEYSDEAWSKLVGSVSAQHVGRLRRVFERFRNTYQSYDGLYWSHFQAALDWDDAEMYLEGAVQNGWSVSRMRDVRWEQEGKLAKDRPKNTDIVTAERDEDRATGEHAPPQKGETVKTQYTEIATPDDEASRAAATTSAAKEERPESGKKNQPAETASPPHKPFEHLGELPEDVTEAFEAFKVCIVRHKSARWKEISREELLGVLDSLKELTLAPAA